MTSPGEILKTAIESARTLGLTGDVRSAEEVLERIEARIGFPGATYVLALAGGTGVGKSSLLNALAGSAVSEVRAVRPTTDQPIAWLPSGHRGDLEPLLDWLGVARAVTHSDPGLTEVAVLDLPDFDSIVLQHRARVDHLLPRVDAVLWVLDPEKYDDERFHAYLRTLAPHASRMRFVLNKADRLTAEAAGLVVADLTRRLRAAGIPEPEVHVVSCRTGEGVAALREALGVQMEGKAMVLAKLAMDSRLAVRELAAAAGIGPGANEELLPERRRQALVDQTVAAAVAMVDPSGVAGQVEAAVLDRARRRGGSLVARLVSLLARLTGRQRRHADPAGYLAGWRRRGTLGRVLNPIRAGRVEALGQLPAASRPRILAALADDDLEERVAAALDRATAEAAAGLEMRDSRLWKMAGAGQVVIGGVLLFALAWYLILLFSPGPAPVTSVDLPMLGPVPIPLVLLTGSLILSAILGWLLAVQARRVGRRLGVALAQRVGGLVSEAITAAGFGGLDRVEAARRRLAGLLSEGSGPG